MARRNAFRVLTVSILVALFALAMNAQTSRGTIAGVITDPSGAIVQKATITATPVAGGEARTVISGDHGEYRIESLAPGDYTVTVKASGFADLTAQNLTVRTSAITSANLELAVAKGSEAITVDASAQQVQTETGDLAKTIDPVAVAQVPYVNLNPYSLATTLPGVTTVASRDDFTNGTSFSVNGLRPRANNFLIDGFDNNDNGIAGQAFQPNNIEAVHEVTVLTNAYAAEFGRGGGSVSNLTFKNGTNRLHGSAWEQYNGSALDALGPEQVASGYTRVPQYVNNVFGFDLGGPIKRDKLFFYGTSQWNRNFGAQPTAAQLFIPTAAGVATLQSLGPNPNVDLLLSAIGDLRGGASVGAVNIGGRPGCPAPCAVDFGSLVRGDTGASVAREWTTRVDYNPTTNDNIFVRYTDSQNSLSPDLFANSGTLPSQDTMQGGPSRVLGTLWSHTFSPSIVNELRFSAQTIDFTFAPLAATEANPNAHLPSIFFTDTTNIFVGGWEQATFPQGRGHKTFQFQDAVSIQKGRHTLKIGADLALLEIRDQIPFNADGSYTVTKGGSCDGGGGTTITCTDLANFIDGFAGPGVTLTKSFGNPRINVPEAQQAYYIQDTWKIKPNFNLDLGLRYEYQSSDFNNVLAFPAVDRNAIDLASFTTRFEQKPDRNNFGPRVGFAYTPNFGHGLFGNNATVIRGGYGMFYDAFFTNISNNTASTAPNTLGGSLDAAGAGPRGIANPIAAIGQLTAEADPTASRFSVDNHLVNPVTHQWNVNIQRELPAKLLAEIAYVGTRGERLYASEQVNPRTPVVGCPPCDSGPRIVDDLGSLVVRGNRGDSNYHGLQTTVSRNVGRLQLRGSYTWSRAIDNSSEIFATSGGASRWQNTSDPRSDRGPSAFNRTHRAVFSWAYELPSPKRGFLNAIAGGWISSGFVSFQTGAPESVYLGGWDQNGDGEVFNDRPSVGNPKAAINYSDACIHSATACSGVGFDDGSGSLVDWNTGAPGALNNFRYIVHDWGSGINGNVGRNSIYYPGRQDWNLSVLKNFNLPGEGQKIQVRADFFNAFNHPNDGIDSLTGSYGNINSLKFLNTPLTRRGARHIALWAKYSF